MLVMLLSLCAVVVLWLLTWPAVQFTHREFDAPANVVRRAHSRSRPNRSDGVHWGIAAFGAALALDTVLPQAQLHMYDHPTGSADWLRITVAILVAIPLILYSLPRACLSVSVLDALAGTPGRTAALVALRGLRNGTLLMLVGVPLLWAAFFVLTWELVGRSRLNQGLGRDSRMSHESIPRPAARGAGAAPDAARPQVTWQLPHDRSVARAWDSVSPTARRAAVDAAAVRLAYVQTLLVIAFLVGVVRISLS